MKILIPILLCLFNELLSSDPLFNQNAHQNVIVLNYRPVYKSNLHYVFGGKEGDRVVSLNFNQHGNLISKTIYKSLKNKNKFVYDEDCKKSDCRQYSH